MHGVDFDASKLYPPVAFPVSRNTPMISPIIQWDHSQSMTLNKFNRNGEWFSTRNILINISDKDSLYLRGHVIDGE
jgi:fatty acid synthase, animal type